ncbi:MAG TPA: hypothetical protein VMI32_21985 [Candidatus Solibacter sp.]|nr:hypothetical protein [Candidatus Solibacter sp.]
MATKNKNKKISKSRKTGAAKRPAKRKEKKKSQPASRPAPKKKVAKLVSKKRKTARKKTTARGKSEQVGSVVFEPKGLGAGSGGQSGDLQGLSNRGGADSESIDELLEEGNAFEAQIVKGVEDAPDADEGEVRTHEVPEDDVPEEYLDNEE